MYTVILIFYCLASIFDPDHLCFRRATYDNINGPGGTIYVIIFGLAGPLMYRTKYLVTKSLILNNQLIDFTLLSFCSKNYNSICRRSLLGVITMFTTKTN